MTYANRHLLLLILRTIAIALLAGVILGFVIEPLLPGKIW
jgi:hypothetical protein